ncbi:MAG: biopolymer transporter ExbD [Planctomycetota bacterium]
MKLETSEPEEIKLEMTSMIDIVFQLLVFFIMTFKVVVMEGDFEIKMPLATDQQDVSLEDELPTVINVQLLAGENGGISSIFVDDNPLPVDDIFGNLNREVDARLSASGDAENETETELEFDIDRNLKYIYTVKAIDAVSGKVDADGNVTKLIEKIKFKDNSELDGA